MTAGYLLLRGLLWLAYVPTPIATSPDGALGSHYDNDGPTFGEETWDGLCWFVDQVYTCFGDGSCLNPPNWGQPPRPENIGDLNPFPPNKWGDNVCVSYEELPAVWCYQWDDDSPMIGPARSLHPLSSHWNEWEADYQ